MSKVIGVINQKGGVGKTTATIELANSLAEKTGKKVLVIDLDQQRNLSTYAGADLTLPTIYDVFLAKCDIAEAVQKCGRIDIITASKELSRADKEFDGHDDIFLLYDVIDIIRNDYDYIFIDNGPARSTLLTMAYVASDYVVIPSDADDGSINGVDEVYKDILKYRQGKRPITQAKIAMLLLNRCENTIIHQTTKEQLKEKSESFLDKPAVVSIRKAIAATECKSFRKPIMDYCPGSNVTSDYDKAASKLLEKIG